MTKADDKPEAHLRRGAARDTSCGSPSSLSTLLLRQLCEDGCSALQRRESLAWVQLPLFLLSRDVGTPHPAPRTWLSLKLLRLAQTGRILPAQGLRPPRSGPHRGGWNVQARGSGRVSPRSDRAGHRRPPRRRGPRQSCRDRTRLVTTPFDTPGGLKDTDAACPSSLRIGVRQYCPVSRTCTTSDSTRTRGTPLGTSRRGRIRSTSTQLSSTCARIVGTHTSDTGSSSTWAMHT